MQDPNYTKAQINAQLEIATNAMGEVTRLMSAALSACESPRGPVRTRKPRRTKAQMAAARAAAEPRTITDLMAPKPIKRARGRKVLEQAVAAE